MKKPIILVLALVLALTIAACGGNSGTTEPSSGEGTTEPSSERRTTTTQTSEAVSLSTEEEQPSSKGTPEPSIIESDETDDTSRELEETDVSTADATSEDFAGAAFVGNTGDDGHNERINGVQILFNGLHSEISLEDMTDIVVTKDGAPLSIAVEWVSISEIRPEPEQTVYEVGFNPSLSLGADGSGTYAFSCKILGVEVSTGNYYFDRDSPLPNFTQPTGSGDESGDSGDTPQADPDSNFTLDASTLEAVDDPYAYIAAELDKAYGDVFGKAEVSDYTLNNGPESLKIRFGGYEIGSIDNTGDYMQAIESAVIEVNAALNEVQYLPWLIRFNVLEDGSQAGDITISPIDMEPMLYADEIFYELKDGTWVEHRYSDRINREEW